MVTNGFTGSLILVIFLPKKLGINGHNETFFQLRLASYDLTCSDERHFSCGGPGRSAAHRLVQSNNRDSKCSEYKIVNIAEAIYGDMRRYEAITDHTVQLE